MIPAPGTRRLSHCHNHFGSVQGGKYTAIHQSQYCSLLNHVTYSFSLLWKVRVYVHVYRENPQPRFSPCGARHCRRVHDERLLFHPEAARKSPNASHRCLKSFSNDDVVARLLNTTAACKCIPGTCVYI